MFNFTDCLSSPKDSEHKECPTLYHVDYMAYTLYLISLVFRPTDSFGDVSRLRGKTTGIVQSCIVYQNCIQ